MVASGGDDVEVGLAEPDEKSTTASTPPAGTATPVARKVLRAEASVQVERSAWRDGGADVVETPEVSVAVRPTGWRKGQILLLLVLLVAAAFPAGVRVSSFRYQPIAAGDQWQGVVVEHVEGNPLSRADVQEIEPWHSRSEVHMPYRSGGRIRYGFMIRNEGRWPITVTDVPLTPKLFAVGDGLRMHAKNDLFGGQPMVDFRPFRLPSGSQRFIELSYRLNDCAKPPDIPGQANNFGWSTNTVEYDVFGNSRRAELEIHQVIFFTYSPKGFQPGCEPTNGSR